MGAGLAAAELEIVARVGINLSAVVGPHADGRVYVEAGRSFGGDATTTGTTQTPFSLRRAYKLGLHLPFLVLPGDLLLLAPILAFTSPKTLEAAAITAAYGGLIPWQRPILTSIGEVQFVFGRKIDFYLYDRHEAIPGVAPADAITYRTFSIGSPIVEWRPVRVYAGGTAIGLSVRLSIGVDVPFGGVRVEDGQEVSGLPSSFFMALGGEFWARRFL